MCAQAGEVALRPVGKAVEQVAGDRQPKHAIAEELQPLVGAPRLTHPRGVRERRLPPLGGQRLDQCEQGAGVVRRGW